MPKIDYSKTIIYKIVCVDKSSDYLHIGSTTNFTKRKFDHKRNCENNSDSSLYKIINTYGGWSNWDMSLLEKFPCNDNNDVKLREKYWFSKLQNKLSNVKNECEHCNRTFNRRDSLTRHYKTCKKTNTILEECKKIIAEQQTQLAQLQPFGTKGGNKKHTVKTKTNNIMNNTINNTNTNNITYRFEFGNENIQERLTMREKKNILEKMHTSLIEYIKLIHFSGKYPEYMNFFCTNLRSNHIQVYSEEQNQFITKFASDFLNSLIDTRLYEIASMHEECKDKIEKTKSERLNNFFEAMESTEESKSKRYMETVADVKMMAYNNKHKFDGQMQHPTIGE